MKKATGRGWAGYGADYTALMSNIRSLENMLARGQDSPALRLALANAYMKEDLPREAIAHLREAVRVKPDYSAAWKAYGKVLAASGDAEEAKDVYRRGISAAEANGDIQAAKEMKVFLRRLDEKAP